MEEEQLLWKSSEVDSMVSVTVGRVMSTLLSARPKKLQDAISRVAPGSQRGSLGSLEEALWFLHKYVGDAAERKEALDEILVPMIENSLRGKELKRGVQTIILLDWLFLDELLFQCIVTNLANVILRKEDRYIALGWCTLVRSLVEYETTMSQYVMNGIREKYNALLKILCSCIPHLSHIVCRGSNLQDGFELPSRLALCAADCFIAITVALTRKAEVPSNRLNLKPSKSSAVNHPIASVSAASRDKKVKPVSISPEVAYLEKEYLLWEHLEELINLVQKILAWSRKSRALHAKGLEQVLKWLQEVKGHGHFQHEAGSKTNKTGVLLLSSCWKHYSILLQLEDQKPFQHYKELLNQCLSGIQFYTENDTEGHSENTKSGVETRKFFLNCLCLLLGRFDGKKFDTIMSEYGLQTSRVLLSQLHCANEDVIEAVVCILKAVIFSLNSGSGSSLMGMRQMDEVLPLLLHLLDERDGTARAVVVLIAEYCSMSADNHCLQEVLQRIASGDVIQRKNAIDVISEIIHISLPSTNTFSHLPWKDIANHLLECVSYEEDEVCKQASNLLPMLDHSLVLHPLVQLLHSSNERVRSSSSDALIGVLRYHKHNHEVICMLLDCLSNLSQSPDIPKPTSGDTKEVLKLESDRVLSLIPEWSKSVQDWSCLIGPLMDKMFAEPSNSVIVRFLSCISEHLAKAADVVLNHVLLHIQGQEQIDGSSSRSESRTYTSDEAVKIQQSLFDHLCPLLIIRLLPVRIFDDVSSSLIYGQLLEKDYRDVNVHHGCVALLLLNRAFSKCQFEDVRKLAAELCGRIHPKILFPIVCSELEHGMKSQDILKIKACLFSVCTSLVVRGRDSSLEPVLLKIRNTVELILSWPSLDGDEISKAQHGCIDCLALMVCAEFQSPESYRDSHVKDISLAAENGCPGNDPLGNSVLSYVIWQLVHDINERVSPSKLDDHCAVEAPFSLSFRLCMANVLISACQKISDSGKKRFARKSLPYLIRSVEEIKHSDVRAACIQILFSAVYHLKYAILPYSTDLLQLSLKCLRKGSEKEKMAGAKLIAALMASEDSILESISGGLLEARSVLSHVSSTDSSVDLQQICNKLLLFCAVAFSAVPLTLYVPPVRNLSLFLEMVEELIRCSAGYILITYPRVRFACSRLFNSLIRLAR